MLNEKLEIKNFGGIHSISAEINKVNILIGPQASGKSIIAKLLYFFKTSFDQVIRSAEQNNTKKEFDAILVSRFTDYFPVSCWPKNDFFIRYEIADYYFEIHKITKSKKRLSIAYSEQINKELGHYRRLINKIKSTSDDEDEVSSNYDPYFRARNMYVRNLRRKSDILSYNQFFIPAGRSFFANLQSSIFTFLSNNKAIDPFLIEFGSFYERMKEMEDRAYARRRKDLYQKADDIINCILTGKYLREKDKDYLIQNDGRKINLSYASSGQQESLPLAIILKYFANRRMRYGATIYIEEPEAHLFPQAQKKMVELIAAAFNTENRYQFIITTHSPYILSSFNNLIQAGNIREKIDNKNLLEKLYRLIDKDFILNVNDLNSYSLKDGKLSQIIDDDYNLIEPNILDSVSDDISLQFDSLLNL